jgi:hypothetical protein
VTCKPSGPKGQMVPLVHVTRKPSGPTDRMEMEKGAIESHRSDGDGERCHRVPQVGWRRVHKHKWHASRRVSQVEWRWRKAPQVHITRKLSGPTGQMEKDPTVTRCMEKGSRGDFYDELQASQMSNCKSHRYTSDGESTVWISMRKRHSLQIEYCSSQMSK